MQAIRIKRLIALSQAALLLAAVVGFSTPLQARGQTNARPTIVLVHGAFAGSSSWDPVVSRLIEKGHPVMAVANPLRGVKSDAAYVANILDTIPGPVILVGHSYGGNVISYAAVGKSQVKALVFVSGLVPDAGESATSLVGKFPGSTLGPTLAPPVSLADGNKHLYILQAKYHDQFAADVPTRKTELMAAAQRPITEAALNESAGVPAWKTIPSWFLYGSLDKNIPPAVHAFMAERAHAVKAVEIPGSSHVVMISHPTALVHLIDEAAAKTR